MFESRLAEHGWVCMKTKHKLIFILCLGVMADCRLFICLGTLTVNWSLPVQTAVFPQNSLTPVATAASEDSPWHIFTDFVYSQSRSQSVCLLSVRSILIQINQVHENTLHGSQMVNPNDMVPRWGSHSSEMSWQVLNASTWLVHRFIGNVLLCLFL